MKKVLVIGHFWPYRGGSKRIIGLAKYLKDFGWEPIIVTGPIEKKPDFDVRYVEVDYRNIFGVKSRADLGYELREAAKGLFPILKNVLRSFVNSFFEVFAFPDESRHWKIPALNAAVNILEEEKIDAVISVWPVTSHLIAKELKNKSHIFWIADFPDLWSQNYNYPYGRIRRHFDKRLEIKTIAEADIITTVSAPLGDYLRKIHKGKRIFALPLGFDHKNINSTPERLTKKFSITYTGMIYNKKQNVLKLLSALKDLISEGIIDPADMDVRFYGPKSDLLEKGIREYNLGSFVAQYGTVSFKESINRQRESQLLLLLNWESPKAKGVYTGKIFEYLAARRPIIAAGGGKSDVVEQLLNETSAGVYASGKEDIKKCLKDFYLEYKSKGEISFNGDILKINKYSQHEIAGKFAALLDKKL